MSTYKCTTGWTTYRQKELLRNLTMARKLLNESNIIHFVQTDCQEVILIQFVQVHSWPNVLATLSFQKAEDRLTLLLCPAGEQLLRNARISTQSWADTKAPGASVWGAIYWQRALCQHPSYGGRVLRAAESRKFQDQSYPHDKMNSLKVWRLNRIQNITSFIQDKDLYCPLCAL